MKGNKFTPFDGKNLVKRRMRGDKRRASMMLSDEDIFKIKRGCAWKATVTDLLSKRTFIVSDASCGLTSCRCAARIVEEVHK
jgi:hypothetical protein